MKSLLSMRPFQIILLVVFIGFAAIGLFLFATYSGFGNGTNKVGTVVVWGTLPAAGVRGELATIGQSDKSYGNVSYVQKDAGSFDQILADAIAAGNGPDLIIINQEQLLADKNKLDLIPFSKQISQRSFLDTYLPEDTLYETSGGVYGVPYVLDPLVLYYNKTLLTTAGVATVPTTWEGVTGLTQALTQLGATQNVSQSTIPFGTYDNVDNARAILSLLFLQAGTPITQNTTTGPHSALASNGSSAASSPAVSVVSFYTQFSDPAKTVYTWNESFSSDRQQFISGNLAMYVGFASEQPQLQAANPNLSFDMATIPQPQTATVRVDYADAYALAVPKASRNPNGALATALALSNSKYVGSAATALSMAPSQRALLGTSPNDLYSPVYYPLALISQGWLSPAPSVTDHIFSDMITNVTSGRMTVINAVATADQAMQADLPQ